MNRIDSYIRIMIKHQAVSKLFLFINSHAYLDYQLSDHRFVRVYARVLVPPNLYIHTYHRFLRG